MMSKCTNSSGTTSCKLDVSMLCFFKKYYLFFDSWAIFSLTLFSPFLAKFLRTFTLETEKSKVCHHNLIPMVYNIKDLT